MLNPGFFNTLFVFPILNVLVLLYNIFLFIKVPGAFGLAIVGLTAIIRLILHPFFKQQLETSKKMSDLKPQLDKLSQKFKKEPKKLQEEQMRLYKEAGINPAAGCLFLIVQFPIFIALYNTLSLFLTNGNTGKIIDQINKVLYHSALKIQAIDPWFFGFNLALSPSKAGQWHYYLIPVITAILQYMQTNTTMMMNPTPPAPEKKESSAKDTGNNQDKKSNTGDFQKAMNTQMKYIFPLMIGYFSYTLPVGLSLYWNIFSLFSIIQYKRMQTKK